jgi:hypothetical protein
VLTGKRWNTSETLLRSIGGSGPPRSSSGRFQERPVVGPVGSLFHFWCPIPVQVRTTTQTCRETSWSHLSKLLASSSDSFPAFIFEFLELIISKSEVFPKTSRAAYFSSTRPAHTPQCHQRSLTVLASLVLEPLAYNPPLLLHLVPEPPLVLPAL